MYFDHVNYFTNCMYLLAMYLPTNIVLHLWIAIFLHFYKRKNRPCDTNSYVNCSLLFLYSFWNWISTYQVLPHPTYLGIVAIVNSVMWSAINIYFSLLLFRYMAISKGLIMCNLFKCFLGITFIHTCESQNIFKYFSW